MFSKKREKGQALIIIVFAIVALVGLTALSIDGGNAYSDRRNAQNAADTSVLAAALAKIKSQNYSDAALARAASNGYVDTDPTGGSSSSRANVEVYRCDNASASCNLPSGADKTQYIQVIITSNVRTYFAPVIGVRQITNKVQAVAWAKPGYTGPYYGGAAIVGLKQTGCDAVEFSGHAQLQIWNAGIFSNSSDSCGLDIQGSTNVQTYDSGINMVATSYTLNGNPTVNTYGYGINPNQAQQPYPPPNLPNPTCTGTAYKAGNLMYAGSYTGTFPPSGVTALQSGVYCINGSFKLNAGQNLSGNNVVIVMQSGDINWNGSAELHLSAPTTGDFAGLLIYAPLSNTSTMQINGSSNSELTGTVLMPAAPIVVNGNNSQLQKVNSQLIGYSVELSGSSDTQIEMNPTSQFQFNQPPTVQLIR